MEGMAMPPRVLVVEDDPSIRLPLTVELKNEGYEVDAQADGSLIDDVVRRFRPDLAVLDVRLPVGPDGYTIARLLRANDDVPVLFLTAAHSVNERLAGFDVGADDYMVKPFSMAELLARARAVLRRAGRLTPAVCQVADLVVNDGARTVTRDGIRLELTPTEYDLLSALAHRPGKVVSKTDLLSQVWGFDAYDVNVVEVHMSALRQKLEAHGPRLIHTRRGAGYELRP